MSSQQCIWSLNISNSYCKEEVVTSTPTISRLHLPSHRNPKKANDRQARQLDYIGQMTTDIRHVKLAENVTADLLSRIESIHSSVEISYEKLADDRETLQN